MQINILMSLLIRYWIIRMLFLFFFNDTATTEIYTLSLHDALPISTLNMQSAGAILTPVNYLVSSISNGLTINAAVVSGNRSEEHTSELQSQSNLVCRLLLEKKNN